MTDRHSNYPVSKGRRSALIRSPADKEAWAREYRYAKMNGSDEHEAREYADSCALLNVKPEGSA